MLAFWLFNGSLRWPGLAATLLFVFASSHRQQFVPIPIVFDISRQVNMLRSLKRTGATISHKRLPPGGYNLSVFRLPDASRAYNNDFGHTSSVIGASFGSSYRRNVSNILNWGLSKSSGPSKSIKSAEIMAAS